MKCPTCGGSEFTDIEIDLETDELVQFHSCRHCESKWWERAGDPLGFDEVLSLTANKRSR